MIMKKLKEYRTKSINHPITDERILKYIDECIDKMEELGFDIPKNRLKLIQTDGTNVFGSMEYDFSYDGYNYWHEPDHGYILRLSKYMFNEPEKAIKNTIYHELCHLVTMEEDIDKGYIYYDEYDHKWRLEKGVTLSHHGPRWQAVADKVGRAINDKITRLGSFKTHTGIGEKSNEKIKYIFKCPSCGSIIRLKNKSRFVKEYNKKDSDGQPEWWCGLCKKKYGKKVAFELIKGE